MTKKIEEFFDLPAKVEQPSTPTTTKTQVPAKFEDLDLHSFDEEMDSIASQAITSFEEIMQRAEMTEDRHAGSVYASASDFLKSALNAKTQKMKARLDAMNAHLKMQQLKQQNNSEDQAPEIQLNSRSDILRGNHNDRTNK